MPAVIHLAAEPDGLVQRCARCDEVLVDYQNAYVAGEDSELRWFVGAVERDGAATTAVDEEPTCDVMVATLYDATHPSTLASLTGEEREYTITIPLRAFDGEPPRLRLKVGRAAVLRLHECLARMVASEIVEESAS